jgi:hypothetical protein
MQKPNLFAPQPPNGTLPLLSNPDKPEAKRKKPITKARKYEDTKFWLFFFFVLCGFRLENITVFRVFVISF